MAGFCSDHNNSNLGPSFTDGFGFYTVNSIAGIGTNIYVTGYYSPIARFSNATGEALPVGDAKTYLGWDDSSIGLSLAINNGHLYLGGWEYGDYFSGSFACLTNPQDANPTGWVTPLTSGTMSAMNTGFLAAATNGNAIYVLGIFTGQDDFGNTSDGFSRWMVGSDGPCPTATITNVTWQSASNVWTLAISGTPGSRWQVISSTDLANWSLVGAVTLWGGTNTFVDAGSYESQPYYQLTNFCGEISPVAPTTNLMLVNVQFGGADDPYIKTGTEAVGYSSSDYWNFISSSEGGGDISLYNALDYTGNSTSVNVYSGGEDTVTESQYASSDNLFNGFAYSMGGEDFQIYMDLPAGTYDIYVYGSYYPTTFTLMSGATQIDSKTGGNVEFSGVTSAGELWINCSSLYEPICNGLQILKTSSN